MAVGETVMDVPVPTWVPPQLPEYQIHCAPVPNDPPVSVKVLDSPELIDGGLADAEVAAVDSVSRLTK